MAWQQPLQIKKKKTFWDSLGDFASSANERLLGGLGRGIIRAAEWAVPGNQSAWANQSIKRFFPETPQAPPVSSGPQRGAFRVSGLTDTQRLPTNYDPYSTAGRWGRGVGTTLKAAADTASLVIPAVTARRAVTTLPTIAKSNRFIRTLGPAMVDAITGEAVWQGQEIGRGNRPNNPGTGVAIDLATQALLGGAGRVIRTARGARPIVTATGAVEGEVIPKGVKVGPDYAITRRITPPPSSEGKGLNPMIRTTRAAQRGVNTVISKGLSSPNPAARIPARTIQVVAGTAGKSDDQLKQLLKLRGTQRYGGHLGEEATRRIKQTLPEYFSDAAVRERILQNVDPEIPKKLKVKPAKLSPEEREVADYIRKGADAFHEAMFREGFITNETYRKNLNKYLTRSYPEFEFPEEIKRFNSRNALRDPQELLKPRKGLSDKRIERMLKDPLYSLTKQMDFYYRKKAIGDFTQWLKTQPDLASPVARPGFQQLSDSKQFYGDLAGQWLRNDVFEDIAGFGFQGRGLDALYTALKAYENSTLRQTSKKVRTIYDPAIRIANYLYNYVRAFTVGLDPVTFERNMLNARKQLKSGSAAVDLLNKEGILGSEITTRELQQQAKVRLKSADDSAIDKVAAAILNVDDKLVHRYGRADDTAKVAMYLSFLDKGFSEVEAVSRTARYLQNYGLVGKAWDISAGLPAFGKAFGRFTGDFIRTTSNNLTDRPLTLIGTIAAWSMISDFMSRASGETPEDRDTREDRLGAGRIPFTDISTEVQTPFGAIDIRRFLGPAVLNDIGEVGGGLFNNLTDFLPFDSPVRRNQAGDLEISGKGAGSDPLIGPVVQQVLDRDFRQLPISDPDALKYPDQPLPEDVKRTNRIRTLARSYTPNPLNVFNDTMAALAGEEDFYGRTKSPTQAAVRGVGVRIEQFGPEQAEKARENKQYFEGTKPTIDALKASYFTDPNKQTAWEAIHPKSKDRYGNDIYPENLLNPQKRALSYLTNPWMLELDKQIAQVEAQTDGKPMDPLLNLPPAHQRQVLLSQGYYQGNGADEKKVLLYEQPWYDAFRQARNGYFTRRNEYYRSKGLSDLAKDNDDDGYPIASTTTQAKLDQMNALASGKGAFIDANPDVKQYLDDVRAWKNSWRIRVGLPPQDEFGNVINPTTGEVYGGFGGRRGGGGGRRGYISLSRYARAITPRAAPQPTASVSVKKPSSGKISTSAPKITTVKSKV